MVPLPDVNGAPASAIVWMNPSPEARRIAALPVAEVAALASERSTWMLGPLTPLSGIRPWPIVAQKADALTAPRTAILAEAAHVVPPIGAQGLNTSLNDLAALLKAMDGAEDPGAEAVLAAYARARKGDIARRVAAIDLFNRVTRSGLPALQSLRLTGLKAVYDAAPLRKAVMRAGMGGA
jgi:2-octaprenyl-6-methoxyphenol hydroxylase